jgi:ribosomal protein S18 acetylase RimI-like enzyme
MMAHLARVAVARGCGRFQWLVHTRNERAIRFYQSMGAQTVEEWTPMVVLGGEIRTLADAS